MAYRAAPATAPVTAPAIAPAAAPYTVGSQFHAQDEFGNLNYGYTNINSAKQEVGNTYGGVQGAYSYVDANGELQRVEYVADDLGFRVADSRLPPRLLGRERSAMLSQDLPTVLVLFILTLDTGSTTRPPSTTTASTTTTTDCITTDCLTRAKSCLLLHI